VGPVTGTKGKGRMGYIKGEKDKRKIKEGKARNAVRNGGEGDSDSKRGQTKAQKKVEGTARGKQGKNGAVKIDKIRTKMAKWDGNPAFVSVKRKNRLGVKERMMMAP